MADELNTMNKYGVAVTGGRIQMLMPPRGSFSKEDALTLAAWLVVLADDAPPHKFMSIVEAVQNT